MGADREEIRAIAVRASSGKLVPRLAIRYSFCRRVFADGRAD
jgi:hypothetical protein